MKSREFVVVFVSALCDESVAVRFLNEKYEVEYERLLEEYTLADWRYNVDINEENAAASVSGKKWPNATVIPALCRARPPRRWPPTTRTCGR